MAGSNAEGAQTIVLPTLSTLTKYPVAGATAEVGSLGNDGIYVGVKQERST